MYDSLRAAEPADETGAGTGKSERHQAPRADDTVPFLDLGPASQAVEDAFLERVRRLLETNAFINGPEVEEFEAAFAEYNGVQRCVGVASGLDALRLALIGLDLEPGDEVIVPAMTFVASLEAVTQAGGVPVPVDVGERDYCLDPAAAAAAVGPRTRVLMPVHLYGQLARMDELGALAGRHGLHLLEDACQAHGASRGARYGAGTAASAFSFYPGKNLGAMGDAGALVTNDETLAERVRALREHGQRRKYEHAEVGWTARLDTIQAAVLLLKLPLLDGWNEQRRAIARAYDAALAGIGDLVLPEHPEPEAHVWHLYVVRTERPEALAEHLRQHEVATGRHYPEAPHLSEAYRDLGFRPGAFPVAERLARECLSLPIFPTMSEQQVERVVDAISSFFSA